MSHNFVYGDIVRIGKGKVEYTVAETQTAPEGSVTVQSNNTGKFSDVESERLTMVQAIVPQDAELKRTESIANARPAKVTVPEFYNTDGAALAAWEVELLAPEGPGDVLLVLDDKVTRYKTFDTAAFRLSRAKGTYRTAGIVQDGKYSVRRAA